jgi:hypothetical protein
VSRPWQFANGFLPEAVARGFEDCIEVIVNSVEEVPVPERCCDARVSESFGDLQRVRSRADQPTRGRVPQRVERRLGR